MPDWLVYSIIIGIVLGCLGGAWWFYAFKQEELYKKDRMRDTFLAQSEGLGEDAQINASGDFAQYKKSIIEHLDAKLSDKFPILGEKIIHAGYKKTAFEWALTVGSITIILSILSLIFLREPFGIFSILFAIAVMVIVPGGAYFMMCQHIAKRVSLFDEQFGVGLDVMSASMKAGGTFVSSMRFIAEGSEPPLATEMGIMATELGLGVDMNTALDRFKDRIPSKNLLIFIIAIKVANQTGAALAPILTTLSQVIVERFKLQGLISIGVSENLIGICILAAMPWMVIPLLAFSWPEAYSEFFKYSPGGIPIGQIIGFISFVWYCFGVRVMYKTVRSIDT
jgi:Flp pilus assembly protein TadB